MMAVMKYNGHYFLLKNVTKYQKYAICIYSNTLYKCKQSMLRKKIFHT